MRPDFFGLVNDDHLNEPLTKLEAYPKPELHNLSLEKFTALAAKSSFHLVESGECFYTTNTQSMIGVYGVSSCVVVYAVQENLRCVVHFSEDFSMNLKDLLKRSGFKLDRKFSLNFFGAVGSSKDFDQKKALRNLHIVTQELKSLDSQWSKLVKHVWLQEAPEQFPSDLLFSPAGVIFNSFPYRLTFFDAMLKNPETNFAPRLDRCRVNAQSSWLMLSKMTDLAPLLYKAHPVLLATDGRQIDPLEQQYPDSFVYFTSKMQATDPDLLKFYLKTLAHFAPPGFKKYVLASLLRITGTCKKLDPKSVDDHASRVPADAKRRIDDIVRQYHEIQKQNAALPPPTP